MNDLAMKRCKPCEGGAEPLKQDEVEALLGQLKGWRVAYKTHAVNGLSENDFICAAKLDKLFEI